MTYPSQPNPFNPGMTALLLAAASLKTPKNPSHCCQLIHRYHITCLHDLPLFLLTLCSVLKTEFGTRPCHCLLPSSLALVLLPIVPCSTNQLYITIPTVNIIHPSTDIHAHARRGVTSPYVCWACHTYDKPNLSNLSYGLYPIRLLVTRVS